MHLIEILLPLTDEKGERFDGALFGAVRRELVEQFGGLTAFTRSPAEGLWETESGTERDEIVVLEVMAEMLDRHWWGDYRGRLERRFGQDEIVIRAREIEKM